MDNAQQQQPAAPLSEWVPAGEYQERKLGGALFPTRSALDWEIKQHRVALIEADALLPGRGRAGSLLHRERFATKVIELRRAAALQREATKPGATK